MAGQDTGEAATGARNLELKSIRAFYDQFAQPMRIGDVPSCSILRPRRKIVIPAPLVQDGAVGCPPIANYEQAEVSVVFLPDVVVAHTGAVIYQGRYLIEETLEGGYGANGLKEANGVPLAPDEAIARSDDIVLNVNKYGTFNYSIFTAEMLPAAFLAGLEPGIDSFAIPMFFPPFMAERDIATRFELLEAVGIGRERIVRTMPGWTRYRGIVLFKINDRYRNHRISQILPAVVEGVKSAVRDAPPPVGRRLYVSRAHAPSRKVRNLATVRTLLDRDGFESMELDSCSLSDQVNAFAEADIVLAEHGAALVNCVYMRPGAILIELVPEPLVGRFMYRLIAHMFRLKYFFGAIPVAHGWRWNIDDIDVDMGILARLLERAGEAN